MKALRNRFAPDTFTVTDTDGKMYTLKGDSISRHRYHQGRVTRVPLDPALCPELVSRILAAVETAPALTPRNGALA